MHNNVKNVLSLSVSLLVLSKFFSPKLVFSICILAVSMSLAIYVAKHYRKHENMLKYSTIVVCGFHFLIRYILSPQLRYA